MSDPVENAIDAEHSRQEREWNEAMTEQPTDATLPTQTMIEAVERIAWSIPAPNEWTPQLIQVTRSAKAVLAMQAAAPAPNGPTIECLRAEVERASREGPGDRPNLGSMTPAEREKHLFGSTPNGEGVDALEPFVTFAEHAIDEEGWTGSTQHERIVDWFGPSDFRRLAALKAKGATPINSEGLDALVERALDDADKRLCGLGGHEDEETRVVVMQIRAALEAVRAGDGR